MFDNVLHQSACDLLAEDIARDKLPGSVLFSGPEASGKLTCALELARVLSCRGAERGAWSCACPSCLRHKALVSPTVLAVGPGNRTLEIAAARAALLAQNANNTRHVEAVRYLYLRAVRKLTIRFSPVLWEDDDRLGKFSPLLQAIDERLEQLQPGRPLPDGDELGRVVDDVEKQCAKLEGSFLYDALPVSQIRSVSSWARLTSGSGRKVLIIENADRMADGARNALLKILEEPPADTLFVLTTARRGAVLPTILSRVRTYTFFERSAEHQREVVSRVFHYAPGYGAGEVPATIRDFLLGYLPVPPSVVRGHAARFAAAVAAGRVPDVPGTVAGCGGFDPRVLLRIFMQGVLDALRPAAAAPAGGEALAAVASLLREAYVHVTVYNQNPAACLEQLVRDMMQAGRLHGSPFRGLEAAGEGA